MNPDNKTLLIQKKKSPGIMNCIPTETKLLFKKELIKGIDNLYIREQKKLKITVGIKAPKTISFTTTGFVLFSATNFKVEKLIPPLPIIEKTMYVAIT